MTNMIETAEELAAQVPDGASLIFPNDTHGVAMEVVRALIRRRIRDLTIFGGPTTGLATDMLIGAGCVRAVETAAVSLGEFGLAPRFREAVESGQLEIRDSTCPAIHAALQASEKGSPFMPLRGVLGSDLVPNRPDWRVINNPFADENVDDPVLLVPALSPDFAIFHAPIGDQSGNVWVGVRREMMTMARAAQNALVSVETLQEDDLLQDPTMAPGTLPSLYVSAVAPAKKGAWPLGLPDHYEVDSTELQAYAKAAKTGNGFEDYLAMTVDQNVPQAAE